MRNNIDYGIDLGTTNSNLMEAEGMSKSRVMV